MIDLYTVSKVISHGKKTILEKELAREHEKLNRVYLGGGRCLKRTLYKRISYYLSCELGMPSAEIARQLVCTLAIVKAIQKEENKNDK